MTESGVKKARIMDPKFTHEWIKGRHFCGVIRWNMNRFFRSKNIELSRIKDDIPFASRIKRIPIFINIVSSDTIDIDKPCMFLGTITDQLACAEPGKINADSYAILN